MRSAPLAWALGVVLLVGAVAPVTSAGRGPAVAPASNPTAFIRGTVDPPPTIISVDQGPVIKQTATTYDDPIASGAHKMVATLGGFHTYYNNFTIAAGQTLWINISLVPLSQNVSNLTFTDSNDTGPFTPTVIVLLVIAAFVGVGSLVGLLLIRRGRKKRTPPAAPTPAKRVAGSGRPAPKSRAASPGGKAPPSPAPKPSTKKPPS